MSRIDPIIGSLTASSVTICAQMAWLKNKNKIRNSEDFIGFFIVIRYKCIGLQQYFKMDSLLVFGGPGYYLTIAADF